MNAVSKAKDTSILHKFAYFCVSLGATVVIIPNFAYVGTWLPFINSTFSAMGLLAILLLIVVHSFLINFRKAVPFFTNKIEFIISLGGFLITIALGFLFFPRNPTFYINEYGEFWLPSNILASTPILFFLMFFFGVWILVISISKMKKNNEKGILWIIGGIISILGSNNWIFPVYMGFFLSALGACILLIQKGGNSNPETDVREKINFTENYPDISKIRSVIMNFLAIITKILAAFWLGLIATTYVSFDHLNLMLSLLFLGIGIWYLVLKLAWNHFILKFTKIFNLIIIILLPIVGAGIGTFFFKQILFNGSEELLYEIILTIFLGFIAGFVLKFVESGKFISIQAGDQSKSQARGQARDQAKTSDKRNNHLSFVLFSLIIALGGYIGSRILYLGDYYHLFPYLVVILGVICFFILIIKFFSIKISNKKPEEISNAEN